MKLKNDGILLLYKKKYTTWVCKPTVTSYSSNLDENEDETAFLAGGKISTALNWIFWFLSERQFFQSLNYLTQISSQIGLNSIEFWGCFSILFGWHKVQCFISPLTIKSCNNRVYQYCRNKMFQIAFVSPMSTSEISKKKAHILK